MFVCWVWSDWMNVCPLVAVAVGASLKFFGLCVMKRRRLGLGTHVRKNVYYVLGFSKGSPQVRYHLEEFLGEYDVVGSRKPWEVSVALLRHGLVSGEIWVDPFPGTHTEELPKEFRVGEALRLDAVYKRPPLQKVVGRRRHVQRAI